MSESSSIASAGARELRPDADALRCEGDRLYSLGEVAAAQIVFEALLEASHAVSWCLFQLGRIAAHQGRWTDAIDRFDAALGRDDPIVWAHLEKAAALERLAADPKAVARERANFVRRVPDQLTEEHYAGLINGAHRAFEAGAWADAGVIYELLVAHGRGGYFCKLRQADLRLWSGDAEGSLRMLEQLAGDPEYEFWGEVTKARALLELKRYDDATETLKSLCTRAPDNPDLVRMLSTALQGMGDFAKLDLPEGFVRSLSQDRQFEFLLSERLRRGDYEGVARLYLEHPASVTATAEEQLSSAIYRLIEKRDFVNFERLIANIRRSNDGVTMVEPGESPGAKETVVFPANVRPLKSPVYLTEHPQSVPPTVKTAYVPEYRVLSVPDGCVCAYAHAPIVLNAQSKIITRYSTKYAGIVYFFKEDLGGLIKDAPYIDGTVFVIFDDCWPLNYCHWIVDGLTRLAYLGFDARRRDCYVATCEITTAWQLETLKKCGFDEDRIIGLSNFSGVRARKLIVPCDLSPISHHPAAKGAPWALDYLRASLGYGVTAGAGGVVTHSTGRKLYVSRNDAKGRRVLNEDELFAALRPAGYERVELSGMSVAEQARLFSSASHIIGIHGAGLTNIVFTDRHCQLLEIFPKTYGTPAYYVLAAAQELPYYCYVGSEVRAGSHPTFDDIIVDVDHFVSACAEAFDDSVRRKPRLRECLFADENDPDAILAWYSEHGGTDKAYFLAHYERFKETKAFARCDAKRMAILDVGAHWLHNAFFYANEGHVVHCVDSGTTLRQSVVIKAAAAMGIKLHIAGRLEFGDGISEIADSSIDLALFCEIIEHLAFNPVLLWKQIYRVMREGSRIVVTTPNALFPPKMKGNIARLEETGEWGPTVKNILASGTFGHHWKEFTPSELAEYFSRLSPDFRCEILETTAETIFATIRLPEKRHGIVLSPPWIPDYRS